ncbi:MAG: D-tyrosyl-tRNA(Tyr) deacylase [Ruminococcus sp.]|jgi:D-tyrosyl-tRNA(Tyr) deacylase|nr:D-tyrosyl-tRNA(Tyr) deacylase [Ruminococcus sp.]
MRAIVQRVQYGEVEVHGEVVGSIEKGFLVYLGIRQGDNEDDADYLVKKICNMRIFSDENDKINLSLADVGGSLLIVSQFTLYADTSHGNRPSFTEACEPVAAEKLYDYFCDECAQKVEIVQRGVFGADMKVFCLNDGPFTILIDSGTI